MNSAQTVEVIVRLYIEKYADVNEVLQEMDYSFKYPGILATEIVGIVVNQQGFRRALATTGVSTVGYPYSISEKFTQSNQNLSIAGSRTLLEKMHQQLSEPTMDMGGDEIGFVVYISMAFGNPYGEEYNPDSVVETVHWLKDLGIHAVSLADTVGKASAKEVGDLLQLVNKSASNMEIGVHLHSRAEGAAEKITAALEAGCLRFDSALTGLGGCPFADDDLVGNIPTEIVAKTIEASGASTGINAQALDQALEATKKLRLQYGN